jgi:ABC-2 type transport system ATP-binding protein
VQLVREAGDVVRDRLAALPGVDTVELRDKVVRIATNQGRSLLASVISTLDDAGCPVSTIDVKEPNLEDLFLNLTGTSLRD